MITNRRQRHILKSIVYRILSIFTTFTILMVFGMSLITSTRLTIVIEMASMLLYFGFEETWDTIKNKLNIKNT